MLLLEEVLPDDLFIHSALTTELPAFRLVPPGQLPAHVSAEEALLAHAYGLRTAAHACSLWGVNGSMPEQPMNFCLWKLMGAVSAARCSNSVFPLTRFSLLPGIQVLDDLQKDNHKHS